MKKKISLKEALVGFSFDIKHLSGKVYTINNRDIKFLSKMISLNVLSQQITQWGPITYEL